MKIEKYVPDPHITKIKNHPWLELKNVIVVYEDDRCPGFIFVGETACTSLIINRNRVKK
ncbi:MAG: hypothetical protein KAS32_21950 [Candidatus Peribacteraceae bacterium]|nr:hypothetical protein [Candidatus Peribacteraceae bacterium]